MSQAVSAVGKTVTLAIGVNPTKEAHGDHLVERLHQMMDGYRKEDPPTLKKLPVEVDIPELMAARGLMPNASELQAAVGDWGLIAYYYLLRVGEYTVKRLRNESKQTKQFRMKDVRFFRRDKRGRLRMLKRSASAEAIMSADSATLRLDNQKNGWKNVCTNHWTNGHPYLDCVRAIARRYLHIRDNVEGSGCWTTFMSAYFDEGVRHDVSDKDMREALKWAAMELKYPEEKGIPVERVDTHSLRMGGANALALAGYSDTQIQKMGRWRGATFKEYIRDELACFSVGMSKDMSRRFGFVNVAAGLATDVTDEAVASPCDSVPDWEAAPAA